MDVQKKTFFFIVVVWGDAYVDMLLQVSLRCFLSPKNIPGLANLDTSKFVFVSTKRDYSKISQSSIFKKLTSYIEPLFVDLDMSSYETVYTQATVGFEKATQLAYESGAYAVYLLPDCIISDGTICQLERYAQEGRDVVLLPGPRVIKEEIISYIDNLRLEDDAILSFQPRQLAEIGLKHFHQQFINYHYNGQGFTKWPHMATWSLPAQRGLLVRAFHLHPLMINCSNQMEPIKFDKYDTIDGSFIKRNFSNINKFLLETDSDNMILFSMTEAKDRIEDGLLWGQKEKLQAIMTMSQLDNMVNELQKLYFYQAYKLHVDELNVEWLNLERESLNVVREVLTHSNTIRKRFSLNLGILRKLLRLFPSALQPVMRRAYWKTQGAVSQFKARFD